MLASSILRVESVVGTVKTSSNDFASVILILGEVGLIVACKWSLLWLDLADKAISLRKSNFSAVNWPNTTFVGHVLCDSCNISGIVQPYRDAKRITLPFLGRELRPTEIK